MALRAPRVPYPETPGPGTPIQPTYSAPDTLPGGLDALPDRQASEHSADEPTPQQAPSQPPTIDSGDLDSLPAAHPMQDALVSAYGADPDQAARVLSLARLSGDSPDQVQANLEKYVKASSTPTPDQMRHVPAVAPGVSRFLSNPSGMAIAKDDVPNLLTQEQLIRDHGTFLNFMDTMGTIASPAASTMSASYGLASQAARIPAGLFTLASTVSNQNARLAAAMTGTQPPSQYPTPKILSKNPVTDWLDEQANAIRPRIMNEEFAPLIQSGQYGSAALKLVNVLATFPPFITALASTGGFGAAALAVGQAGEATKQAQDAGVSAEAGGLNAVGQAATFGLMGEIGPLQILRNFRATVAQQAGEQVANSVMKKVGGLMVRGFVPGAESQMVMTAGNAMSEWASGVNPHALEGLASKMAESGLAGGIAGAFGAIPEAVELQHQAERARQSKEFITSLGDTVEAGKLKARMPEAQRALIDEITADGPVKSVFMPVSRFIDLFQSAGKDPEEVAADAGLGDSFEEAKRTGGSVEIPLATWADKFTGTTYGELGDDIKLSADELTINEVKDREAEVKAMVDKQTASQPDAEQQARLDESAARVRDAMAQKFEGAVIQGRKLSKSDATAQAKLFAAGIKSAAARQGVDPFTLFSRTFGSLMLGETPEKPLTEEDMAAIEAEAQQQYMDQALVENGGLTPVMDSLRGFGGLDYADLKANGYRGEFTDLGYSGVFKPGGRKLHDAANHLVEQGLIPENDYRHIFDALRSESQAITDFKHNRSASEYNNIRRRLEQGPNKNLIIQHNLSAEDLIHADRVGGLAVPSMAITKSGEPATGFGEITLIGDSKLADPQGYARTKVYGADVYAPRYPPVHYKFKFARLKELSDQLRTIAKEAGVSGIATDEIRDPEDLRRSGAVMAAFLKEKGIKFKKSTGEGTQFSKEIDTRRNMEQVIRKNKLDGEFESFADRMFRGLDPEERLFNGFNYNGDRKYKAHTLENVVSILKKNVRAGEGFNYGVGTLRATVTPQFRSLTEIRKESSRIVGSEEFKAIKEEVDGEFFKLADELKPYYKNEAGFGYADTAIQMMGDVAKFGMNKALEENQFANVPDEVKQKMADYLNKLRELPTEYFEAKIPRAVGLQEFKAAVVPEDLAPETRKLLEAKGLKIETYPKGGNSEQARKEAIARAASKHGLLFQSQDGQEPRGGLSTGMGGQMDIHLFRTADLSTFLHESGHFFLNVLTEQAIGKGATPETKVLYEDVSKWLGADPWDVEANAGFTRDQHEKFARGFEAYLREGKAPTTGLRRAFAKFSDWLVKIYRSVAGLNVEVSPAVRDIMDRLLTTDNELTKARAEAGQDQQLPALPPEVQAKIGDIQARAKESAYESLIKERMGELRAENQKVDKERRAEALTKAEAAVDQQPLFVARKAITEKIGKGMFKAVDRILAGHPNESDTAMFSTYAEVGGFKDAHDLAQALKGSDREAEVKKLVDQQMAQYDKSTNGDLRLAAAKAVHTDNSGEAMALERDILAELIQKANQASAAKKEKSTAAAQQKAKIEEAGAPAKARAAESASTLDLAGKTWDQAVQEWNAQASRASRIKAKVDYEAAKIYSRDALRGKQYAEAGRWRTYVTAERNAASKAAVALYKEDFSGYMKAKNEQITNHALASEAMRVAADTRGILKYFDKLTADTRQARIGKAGDDYLEQIQALLSRYGVSDTPSSTTDGKRPLAEFVKDAERSGQTLGIPQYMLDESVQKPSRMMTYGELSDLRGATRAIETLARQANEIIGQEKGRTMDDLRQELHSSVTAELAAKGKTAAVDQGAAHDPNPGTADTVEAARRRGVAWLSRPLFLIGEIDGHKANGPAFRNLWSRKVESENTENRMLRTFREFDKSEVFGRYSREERGLFFTRKYDIPEIGPGVRKTKEEMLMIAANWLSDGNRQKLVEDNGFNEDQIKAVFKHLDQRDIYVLESMQKHLESYRDPVSEQVRKLRGEQIEWVEPAPYEATLSDGKVRSMKGGYFPIIMDRERSQRAALPEDIQNVSEMFGGDWSQWTTKNGHTQERVGSKGRPLDLRLSGFYNHVYNVVHDLAYRENLIALHKMVNDKGATDDAGNRVGPSVKDDIISAVGREKWEELNAWIGRMAGDSKKDPTEGWARWLRNKTTTAILAWRLTPGIKHIAAAFTTIHELGPKYAAAGYGKIINLRENLALAESLFPEFKDRNDAGDRDLHDFVKGRGLLERQGNIAKLAEEAIGGSASAKVAWLSSFKKDAELSFFQFVRWVDKFGSMGALLGSYKKALDGEVEGIAAGDDAAARAHAVRVMQEIKGAGGAGDLARIQGGSDTQRLFTMLYSMKSIKFNQYAKSIQQGTGYKGWTGIAGGGLVSAFAMKWVAEAMWDELIHGMPEDDKKKKKFGWDIATYPGDSVPFVNDAMHYAVNKLAAHLPYDYKASPALDFVPEAVAAASGLTKQLTGGDALLSEKRAEAHMAGVLFGLPGPMIFQVLDRIEQWETGDNKPENSAQGMYQTLVSGTPRQ